MGGSYGAYGERTSAYGGLAGKSEGQRPLGRPSVNGMIIFKRIFKK
jgi:hypothetical protein